MALRRPRQRRPDDPPAPLDKLNGLAGLAKRDEPLRQGRDWFSGRLTGIDVKRS
jgi:hypothetical protein